MTIHDRAHFKFLSWSLIIVVVVFSPWAASADQQAYVTTSDLTVWLEEAYTSSWTGFSFLISTKRASVDDCVSGGTPKQLSWKVAARTPRISGRC